MEDQKKEEEWATIEGCSNYEISNYGRVRSKTRKVWNNHHKTYIKFRGKLMRQRRRKRDRDEQYRGGQCVLHLMDDNKQKRTVYPQRETAKIFVPNDDKEKIMIIQIDHDPSNNYFENLRWVTRSEHRKWHIKSVTKNKPVGKWDTFSFD